jgi:hypothetical protein
MTSAISSITSAASVPRPAEYSITDLALTFIKERGKDIAKAGSYLAFWATQAIPDLPPNVTKFNFLLKDFKNFISVTEIPEKLCTLSGSVSNIITDLPSATMGKVGTAARKVFKDTMSLINSTADTIDFASLFVPICKETLRWVSGINCAATAGFAGNGIIEQIQNINGMSKIDPKRTAFYLINLARDVSYLAVGVIGLASVLTIAPVAPWMIVSCLTSGLSFSIGSYFYERLVDPENKGKNLNPAIVVENQINQRNYAQRSIPVPV